MGLFDELKRRNVIRVAVAYVVGSWLLLQITDVLMSVLGLPEIVGKAVFLVLVIGFIPALVFSWAFEITPEGLKRDAEVTTDERAAQHTARKLDTAVIVMLAAVAALVIYDRVAPRSGAMPDSMETAQPSVSAEPAADTAATPAESALPRPTAVDSRTSVAVLPFTNMSPDPDNEFFADGISEELLNVLVDVEGLRVPSRTSSFAFKGRNLDIREIATQLQVDHVLEGSVRKAGNQVRITAQLIDVSTDTHLWSETYDRELEDIFAIQDEIAGNIVQAMSDVLEIAPRAEQPTNNLDAYTRYLRGRYLFQQRGDALREAEQVLREAVALDPGFAEAWGTLANTCLMLPNYLGADRQEASACARKAAERALALDRNLAEPKIALAQLRVIENDHAAAIELYNELVREHPNHALGRLWFGVELAAAGYLRRSLEQFQAAAALDPSYGLMLDWLARGFVVNGQLDEALDPAARALELGRLEAGVPLIYRFLAQGSLEDLARMVDMGDEANWGHAPWLFRLRENPERLDEALVWVESMRGEIPARLSDYHLLSIMLTGGTPAQAFEQVRAVTTFDDTIGWLVWAPPYRRLLGTEPMKAWAHDMGYVDTWRQHGSPDLCRPVGDDDFECGG